jgi:hypothetical protein
VLAQLALETAAASAPCCVEKQPIAHDEKRALAIALSSAPSCCAAEGTCAAKALDSHEIAVAVASDASGHRPADSACGTFFVSGIGCGPCVFIVEQFLRELCGVHGAVVDVITEKVRITWSKALLSVRACAYAGDSAVARLMRTLSRQRSWSGS